MLNPQTTNPTHQPEPEPHTHTQISTIVHTKTPADLKQKTPADLKPVSQPSYLGLLVEIILEGSLLPFLLRTKRLRKWYTLRTCVQCTV